MEDLDDRVTCQECPSIGTREASESLHKDQVMKSRRLGHRVELPGDTISRRGQWMTLTWQEQYCTLTGNAAMPKGVKHRCPLAPKPESALPTSAAEKEWWE